jgi:hypothetical protein
MLKLTSVLDTSIPSVDPLDLESFWALQSRDSDKIGVAYTQSAILSACKSPTADPIAIWARATFIHVLLGHGLLDKWRDGQKIQKVVFDAVAVFPLPGGLRTVDPAEFIATLPA